MRPRSLMICATTWASVIVCATGVLNEAANAQDVSNRAGKTDMIFEFNDFSAETIDGGHDSKATVKADVGFGFNLGYNVDNYWAFGVELSGRRADYTTTVAPAAGNSSSSFNRSGTIDSSTTALTATYNFSPSRLTPFVTANVGRTWIDTNIPNGPPGISCWYDPWWGQYCGTTVPTKSDVYWSYGMGVGLRWDSKGPFFLRALVGEQWLDVGGNVGTPNFTQFRVDLGFRF